MTCTRCLYPDTKPDLFFDDEGVCSACRAHEARKLIDWDARRTELEALLETGKNDSGYDCIVPSSGGKDSTYQVITLLEMGARPLVVTATTCHLTDIGRKNIDNLARYATTIEVSPNKTVRAKLNKLGLNLVGDISWPEHVAIFTTPFQMAVKHGIPLIIYGESPQNAYGGPPGTAEAKEMTSRWVAEFGGFNGLRAADMVGQDGITRLNMFHYQMPHLPESLGVRAYFLGQFLEWDSHRNAEVAMQHGMDYRLPSSANWWFRENLDNAQTGIHDYFCWLKYGFGRFTAQISVDIRNGLITQAEAEASWNRIADLYPREYMGVPLDDILAPIDVTRAEFEQVCERFTNDDVHGERMTA